MVIEAPSFDPKSFLAKVGDGRTLAKYLKDRTIFSQGDSADAVFYIQKGKVKVTVVSEQGKEAVVAILGPDDFCGEGCLAGQPRRMATATAMMECEIMRLETKAIIRILHDEPAFSEMFVSHLLARTIRVEEDVLAGGLMSYGMQINDLFRRAAGYVDKILKGRSGGPSSRSSLSPNRASLLPGRAAGPIRGRPRFLFPIWPHVDALAAGCVIVPPDKLPKWPAR
jgi:CRP-like cAMP-binding protein